MGTEQSTPDQVEQPVVDDRRAVIEAAFEAAEKAEATPPPEPKEEKVLAPESKEEKVQKDPLEPKEEKAELQEEDPEDKPAPTVSVDKPPQSWRAPQKAKWDKLDPDIRQEVVRREKETTRVLGESAQARQFATNFQQMVQPFMPRLQAIGADPLVAVQELFKADYLLSTGGKSQKAALMAKLIKDYDVDVMELDSALSGKGGVDPIESRVEALVQQRIAPIQQFLQKQQQDEYARSQAMEKQIATTIEQMENDPVKFPHFEQVRETMADIVDILAKREQHITAEEAYNRAVAMDPTISQQVAATAAANAKAQAAANANAKAQKALKASASVGGSPGGTLAGTPNPNDRRATIAAALDAVGGR